MIVVAPTVTEDGLPAVVERVTGLIETQDGTIESFTHESPWGHRRLAYPIQNFRDAFYVLYYFDIAPRAIAELDRELRLDSAIIRHLIVKYDPLTERGESSDSDDEDGEGSANEAADAVAETAETAPAAAVESSSDEDDETAAENETAAEDEGDDETAAEDETEAADSDSDGDAVEEADGEEASDDDDDSDDGEDEEED